MHPFPALLKDLFLFGITAVASVAISSRRRGNDDTMLQKSLREGTSLNASEHVFTVDENNNPTPKGHPRAQVRLENLWHRATYIVVRHEEEDTHEDEEYMLVQKRSKLKDYCPNKLDPAPGGVVGFGESYHENVVREMEEEMGIDVESPKNSLKRLFTFKYTDDRVRCWGDLYEAVYRGPLSQIVMQEEEVEEVMRLSVSQVQDMVDSNPDAWMPDGLHALRLYLQFRLDAKLKRRLLKGYSSGNLDAYSLRPKPEAIFFDCDDCLYFDGWKVANQLTAKIDEWCVKRGLPEGEAYELYKRHGTALRGLLAEGHMEHCEEAIDAYLEDVHDLPISEMLSRDEELRQIIQRIDPSIPKYIFTASVHHHAERCLEALGIDDLFEGIIDVKACDLHTKHSREAFEAAMKVAGVDNAESCIFLDDSIRNIQAAREVGWRSILVGRVGRDCGKPVSTQHAEHDIEKIHNMPEVLPELFDHDASR